MIIAVEEKTSVDRVVALMETIISRIPVTRKGQIAGIVGRVDLLRLIATAVPDDCSPPLSEAAFLIRRGEAAFDGLATLPVIVSEEVVHPWVDVALPART